MAGADRGDGKLCWAALHQIKKKPLICPPSSQATQPAFPSFLQVGDRECWSDVCSLGAGRLAAPSTQHLCLTERPQAHKTYSLEQRELHLLLSLNRGVSSGQNPLTGVSRLTNLRKPTAQREGAPCHPWSLRSSARGCCPEPSSTHLAQAARQPLRGARPLALLLAHASAVQLRPPSRSPPFNSLLINTKNIFPCHAEQMIHAKAQQALTGGIYAVSSSQ